GGESFLGFAFILLGLLMGFGDSIMRILAFVAAGGVWMYQALSRRHPLHYWIALTLFGLGGASVGLLKDFPGVWLPAIGIALAMGYGVVGWLSRERDAAAEKVAPDERSAAVPAAESHEGQGAFEPPRVAAHFGVAAAGTAALRSSSQLAE